MTAVTEWRPVTGPHRGVAIANYRPELLDIAKDEEAMGHLRLLVGNQVVVSEECEGWYLGRGLSNPTVRGIFPKSFINLYPAQAERLPPLVAQIESALFEWDAILRDLFAKGEEKSAPVIKVIQDIMREVMTMRDLLVANKMTRLEVKALQRKVITKMVFLNHQLELDLVVRDQEGNIMSKDK